MKEIVPKFAQYLIAKEYGICEGSESQFGDFFIVEAFDLSKDKRAADILRNGGVLENLRIIVIGINQEIAKGVANGEKGVFLYDAFDKKHEGGTPTIENVVEDCFDIVSYLATNQARNIYIRIEQQVNNQRIYPTVTYRVNKDATVKLIKNETKYPMPDEFKLEDVKPEIIEGFLSGYSKAETESEYRSNNIGNGGDVYVDNRGLKGDYNSILAVDYHNGEFHYNKMQGEHPSTEQMFEYTRLMNRSISKKIGEMNQQRTNDANKDSLDGKLAEINSLISDANRKNKAGEITMDEWRKTIDSLNKQLTEVKRNIRNAKKNNQSTSGERPNWIPNVSFDALSMKKQNNQYGYDGKEDVLYFAVPVKGVTGAKIIFTLSKDGATFKEADYNKQPMGIDDISNILGVPNNVLDFIPSVEEMPVLYQEMIDREKNSNSGAWLKLRKEYSGQIEKNERSLENSDVEEIDNRYIDNLANKYAGKENDETGIPMNVPPQEEDSMLRRANESFDIFRYIQNKFKE